MRGKTRLSAGNRYSVRRLCVRCRKGLTYVAQQRLEAHEQALTTALFYSEEGLLFDVFVCPTCGRAELVYAGSAEEPV